MQEQMLPDGTLDTPQRGSVGDVAVDSDCVEAIEAFRQHEIHHSNLAKPPMTGLMWCQPNGKHCTGYARAFDKDLVAPSFTVITGGKSKVA